MAQPDRQKMHVFFAGTPLLALLCQQNGWPDADSVRVGAMLPRGAEWVCGVAFEEILMQGAGCPAGRLTRWGQFALQFDADGGVREAHVV